MSNRLGQSSRLTQRTLKKPIHCTGVGLHSGRKVSMTIAPADSDAGIVFVRTDVAPAHGRIPARWDRVVDTTMCTVLGNEHGVTVGTVEHLMASLRGCEIDNAEVWLDGPEVPVMDGSSEPFVFLIECVGVAAQPAPRRGIRVLRDVGIGDETRYARLRPGFGSSFSFEIDFQSRAVAHQTASVSLVNGTFRDDICRARTFGFLHEVDHLRKLGLARGGSLDNAIVIDGDRIVNTEGLRYDDEFVRHKILDSIGDLYLAGLPIIGHYHGYKAGHQLNNQVLQALFADPGAWSIDELVLEDTVPEGWSHPPKLVANA